MKLDHTIFNRSAFRLGKGRGPEDAPQLIQRLKRRIHRRGFLRKYTLALSSRQKVAVSFWLGLMRRLKILVLESPFFKQNKSIKSAKGLLCRGFDQSTEKKQGERRKEMRKGILLVLVLGLMVFCATKDSSAQGGPPVLEKVWASPVMPNGSLVKIYIKASDPDGDMKWLYISGGVGKQSVLGAVPIRLKGESTKSLDGYVYWDSSRVTAGDVSATAEISVEDAKGNESGAKSITFELKKGKDVKAQKAPSDFQDKEIGPIMMQSNRGM
jgi:hypothetical protein